MQMCCSYCVCCLNLPAALCLHTAPTVTRQGLWCLWLCAPGACVVPLVGFCCVQPLQCGCGVQQMSPFYPFLAAHTGLSKPCQQPFYLVSIPLMAFGPPSGAGRWRLTGFMACHVTSVADGQMLWLNMFVPFQCVGPFWSGGLMTAPLFFPAAPLP